MSLSFQHNYWDSLEQKSEFMRFLVETFGLDLSLWNSLGFWDQQYRPFSYFSGGTLVSNVCVYSMDMTIGGKRSRVAQISAVGTIPEFRRQGLSSELTQKAMAWARDNHDFFFLFADEEAYPLYQKSGFRHIDEYKVSLKLSGKAAKPGVIKLDIRRQDHLAQIHRIASDRSPVSDLLGVSNTKLFMFWCLSALKDHIYYLPDLDVLVLYERNDGLVTYFDIVGKHVPTFAKLYPYICEETDEAVEFLFEVDKMNLRNFDRVQVEDNGTHVLGNFPLENSQFIFPFTAQA